MHVGLLWLDNSQTALSVKVQRAADYYAKKYGRRPDLCLVNPGMMTERTMDVEKVTVRPYRSVLPGHLWIGIDEAPDIEKVKEVNKERHD